MHNNEAAKYLLPRINVIEFLNSTTKEREITIGKYCSNYNLQIQTSQVELIVSLLQNYFYEPKKMRLDKIAKV